YVGGYEDWVRQRDALAPAKKAPPGPSPAAKRTAAVEMPARDKKLSYKERRELDELPARIEALEAEQRVLGEAIAGASFYRSTPATIAATLERSELIVQELAALYERWDALDSRS